MIDHVCSVCNVSSLAHDQRAADGRIYLVPLCCAGCGCESGNAFNDPYLDYDFEVVVPRRADDLAVRRRRQTLRIPDPTKVAPEGVTYVVDPGKVELILECLRDGDQADAARDVEAQLAAYDAEAIEAAKT